MPVQQCKTPEEFSAHVNEKPGFGQAKGVVVDFTAAWCGPCKMFAPIFEAMSNQYPSITFLKVDVDELQAVAQSCGISAMPTCQAYVNAQKVDEFKGADQRALTAMLTKVSSLVAQSSAGQGRRLGGSEPSETPSSAAATSAVDEAAERRARMAAAAEARLKQMGG